MPMLSKIDDRQQNNGSRIIPPSTVYAQPWWRSVGNNAIATCEEQMSGSATMAHTQANDNGSNKEANAPNPHQSGLNGNNVQEQHLKHVPSSMPPAAGEHLEPNLQMELVGHSIMLTSCPYPDPHYGGMMVYGAQVHPHLLGMHSTRMPLPLEMEEEPVYVNAKQYHGILRRRQIRAKLELEKKAIKSRKPYLHESRHQHAMRRARGCGGRFLNTKKGEENADNQPFEKDPNSGTTLSTNSSDFRNISQNGNTNGHGFFSMQSSRSTNGEDMGD